MCQNPLVPALDAGPQKDRPYQSDFYRAGFNAIPRQAREQDSFEASSQMRGQAQRQPGGKHRDKPVPALDAGSQRSRRYRPSPKSRQALFPA